MTQIQLQNPEKQAKFNALMTEFEAQKSELIKSNDELAELERKKAKNNATLTAVNNEFGEKMKNIYAKFDKENELSIDDFTETQKLKAELKARIDFFTAAGEELDEKIYLLSEKIYFSKLALKDARNRTISFLGYALLDEFIEQNKVKIELFKGLIIYGVDTTYDRFSPNDASNPHAIFERAIKEKFALLDNPLSDEFKMPELVLNSSWKPKTPTQKHLESFQPKENKGFKRLLNEMQE